MGHLRVGPESRCVTLCHGVSRWVLLEQEVLLELEVLLVGLEATTFRL